VQMVLLLCITLYTNWNKEVLKANDRVFSCPLPVDDTITSGCSEQGNGCNFVGNKQDDANGAIERTNGLNKG